MKGPRPKKRSKKRKFLFRFSIFVLVIVLLLKLFNGLSLVPAAVQSSESIIHNMATELVTKALSDTLAELQIKADELIAYSYNDAGEVIFCGVNTVLVNQISTGLLGRVNSQIAKQEIQKIYIPLGRIFTQGLFSNSGPLIEVSVKPCGVAGINYDHSFTSVGINQVNYRVWLHMNIEMQVYLTNDSKKMNVTQDIVLVDQVINGKVPDSYVNVPDEDSMLNFVDQ